MNPPHRTSLSRRQLLALALGSAGAAAVGAMRFERPAGAASGALGALVAPGSAYAPAERFVADPPPPPPIERPPAGQIAFPLDPASDCYVLDNFGDCRSGCTRLHEGVDIMGSKFQPIYAVADGVLTKRYVDTGLTYGAGNGWTLHDEENDVVYRYFHMDSHADGLEAGDDVEFGQVIGYVGNTGTSGLDNYHLHFEYRPNNVAVNPLPMMVVDDDMCGVSPPIRG